MTSLTDTQVITASGGLVELGYAERTSTYTIPSTSSSFADPLCGTVTIVTDGSPLLVEFQSPASSVATGGSIYVNLVVNGSVTGIIYQSTDGAGAQNVGIRASRRLTLSAGTHTINVSAWGSGSPSPTIQAGNGGVGSFHPMFLRVSKIVEATQWPAVTTGTIICTSSTRPASPFEGQVIYETDTGLSLIYDGSAWVSPSVTHKPPSCLLSISSLVINSQVDLGNTTTGGTWTEVVDTDTMHDAVTNPTRITVNTPGIYLVTASLLGNASNINAYAMIKVNGTQSAQTTMGNTYFFTRGQATLIYNSAVNDYYEFQTAASSSITCDVRFSATWLGKA